jgi:hypothetical protein
MKNIKVYCVISVCSCFIIISMLYIFLVRLRIASEEMRGYWQRAALPMSSYIVQKIPLGECRRATPAT